MPRIIFFPKKIIILLILSVAIGYSVQLDLELNNCSYAYNGESATYWDYTRTTITYLQNVFEPVFIVSAPPVARFKFGGGLLYSFDQETRYPEFFPIIQIMVKVKKFRIIMGSLENKHNLPTPILDPLISFIPEIRVISESRVPIDYEKFPVTGRFSHGRYEYGLMFDWTFLGSGEVYMNWQLLDTKNHRERFDVGFDHTFPRVPFYLGAHYWHNGGHENPHPVSITENYVWAAGFRNRRFSALYLGAYWLPNRDNKPELNMQGNALYFSADIPVWKFIIQPEIFASDELITSKKRFVSIEGDPFFRVPFYGGINFLFKIKVHKTTVIDLRLVNGVFLPHRGTAFSWKMIRYDQMLKIDFSYAFTLYKGKKKQKIEEKTISISSTEENTANVQDGDANEK